MYINHKIVPDHEGLRIDKWFKINIKKIPQSLVEKLLRNGKIKVNNVKVKSSYKLFKKDTVKIFDLKLKDNIKKISFEPSKKELRTNEDNIIFDNENYIVINKKNGISVQGGTKSKKNLVDIFKKSKFFKDTKPYTVHRIDKETSGILIIAKNRKSAQFFTSLFRIRKIHKTYLAICLGELNQNSGEFKHVLKRYDKNKMISENAITKFKVIDRNQGYTFLELKPITGRKHQLRKQTSELGIPIVGDSKYSNFKYKNLLLHSYSIKFIEKDKKFTYYAPLPDFFINFLKSKRLNFPNRI